MDRTVSEPPPRTLGRRSFLAAMIAATTSHALGRIPYGGAFKLRVPWPLAEMDPHDLFDPVAAFFGGAVFDTLYALDADGKPYAALAADLPESATDGARITLRSGLVTARGTRIGS